MKTHQGPTSAGYNRCDACRDTHGTCQGSGGPCKRCATQNLECTWDRPLHPSGQIPQRPPGWGSSPGPEEGDEADEKRSIASLESKAPSVRRSDRVIRPTKRAADGSLPESLQDWQLCSAQYQDPRLSSSTECDDAHHDSKTEASANSDTLSREQVHSMYPAQEAGVAVLGSAEATVSSSSQDHECESLRPELHYLLASLSASLSQHDRIKTVEKLVWRFEKVATCAICNIKGLEWVKTLNLLQNLLRDAELVAKCCLTHACSPPLVIIDDADKTMRNLEHMERALTRDFLRRTLLPLRAAITTFAQQTPDSIGEPIKAKLQEVIRLAGRIVENLSN